MTAVTKWTVLTRGVVLVVFVGSNETGTSGVVVVGKVVRAAVELTKEDVTEGLD